jgi:dienelactone hydrolase
VYLTGFSYGGKAVWEFFKADRELFTAGLSVAGWPVGKIGEDPTTDPVFTKALKLEVQRYKHVPVRIFAGDQDQLRFGCRAVHEELTAQGGNSAYTEFPNTAHVPSAGKTWGNRQYILWLFSQRRARLRK